MTVAVTTIKAFGFDGAQSRLKSVSRFVKAAPRMIGNLTAGVVRRSIKQLPKKTTKQFWERSVEYEVNGKSVHVFYNLAVAKYARIRELGGEIKPFRFWSMKFIGRDGNPAFFRGIGLFVPLRPGVRPRQPGLKWGVDFVISKRVRHPNSHVMQYAIRRELLADGGMVSKTIRKKLGLAWNGKQGATS